MGPRTILLVDDEEIARREFAQIVRGPKYVLETASCCTEAVKLLASRRYDLVVLDLRMPDFNNRYSVRAGIDLLTWIMANRASTRVIMLSLVTDVTLAVEAMRAGAKDYVLRDRFSDQSLLETIEKVLKKAPADIQSLIKGGETETVEFKASLRFDYKTERANKDLSKVIAKTVAGFMNSQGGHLLIGVSDRGEVLGIGNDLRILTKGSDDAFLSALYQIIIDHLGNEFCQKIHPEIVTVGELKACVIAVEPWDSKPVWFSDGSSQLFYIRAGQSTRPLNARETVEYITTRSAAKW